LFSPPQNFAKEIRRAPGSYFKLTDKEADFFALHDIVNAHVYADGAAAVGAGTSGAKAVDYRTALNSLFNAPVASPVRALTQANPRPYLEALLLRYKAAAANPEAASNAEVLSAYGSADAVAAAATRLEAALEANDLSAETLSKVEGERDKFGRVLARAADGTFFRRVSFETATPTFAETGKVHRPAHVYTEFVEGVDRDAVVARYPPVRYTERQRYVKGANSVPLDLMLSVIRASEGVPVPEAIPFNPDSPNWRPEMLLEEVQSTTAAAAQDTGAEAHPLAMASRRAATSRADALAARLLRLPRYSGAVVPEGQLLHREAELRREHAHLRQLLAEAHEAVDRIEAQANLELFGSGRVSPSVAAVMALPEGEEADFDVEGADGELDDATTDTLKRLEQLCVELGKRVRAADDALQLLEPEEEAELVEDAAAPAALAEGEEGAKPDIRSRAVSYPAHLMHSEILTYSRKMEVRRQLAAKKQQRMQREAQDAAALAEAQRKAAADAALLQARLRADAEMALAAAAAAPSSAPAAPKA
jgi:hypothetical protein